MDTDSLYLELAEENLEDCFLPENKTQWLQIRRKDCRNDCIADAKKNFLPLICCVVPKKHDKRERGLLKEEFRYTEILLCRIAAMIVRATNLNLVAKDSTKER